MAAKRRRGAKRGAITVHRGRVTESFTPPEAPVRTERRREAAGGRILEARGAAPDGGRIFHAQIIEPGVSRNRVRYPETVLTAAARLYEGAKAYDHHRTEDEMNQGALRGLVGSWRNVTASPSGLVGDLHLLPSATHVAEALDASVAAQAAGLEPLIGISHDVQASTIPAVHDGAHIQEATAIHRVFSADVVSDPAAGGRALLIFAA